MADFKTHLTVSTTLGVAYGGGACLLFDVPHSAGILAGGLCAVSGMLPDVDSNSGRPLRESLAFGSAVVAMMTFYRFQSVGLSAEWTILAGALVYVLVRFLFGEWLRSYTVHRGMFHSLPAAAIMGQLAFLLASGDDVGLRWFKAGGVVIGYLSHLLLDEVYSFQWRRGRLRLKKSFGTALKMYRRGRWWPNVSTYAKLALLTYVVIYEPAWMDQIEAQRAEHWARQSLRLPGERSDDPVQEATAPPGASPETGWGPSVLRDAGFFSEQADGAAQPTQPPQEPRDQRWATRPWYGSKR